MFLCACSGASHRSGITELWKTGFRTEIEGTLSGVPFTALVHGKLHTDGTTEASVQYLSIGSNDAEEKRNNGILLFREPDGTVSVAQNDHTAHISEKAAAGLLKPLDCLLRSTEPPSATEWNSDGIVLFYPDGVRLNLSPNGTPESGETETMHFRVVWWEKDQ